MSYSRYPTFIDLPDRLPTDPEEYERYTQARHYNLALQSLIDRGEDRRIATDQFNRQLDAANRRAQEAQRQAQQDLQFRQNQANRQAAYQQSLLQHQRQVAAGERQYRQQHLSVIQDQNQWNRAEQQRVREQSAQQFEKQFGAQKEQFEQNLAFNKERAAKTDEARARADAFAESGTRRQVLASLGYGTGHARTTSPLESILGRAARRQRSRRRLRVL